MFTQTPFEPPMPDLMGFAAADIVAAETQRHIVACAAKRLARMVRTNRRDESLARMSSPLRWVRRKSLMGLRDKIRALTKRNRGDSIESIIASIDPTLRGWFGYFQHAHRYTFSSIDSFVRRRLRAILRRQLHRPGQGHCFCDHTPGRMPSSLILGCSRCPRPFDSRR